MKAAGRSATQNPPGKINDRPLAHRRRSGAQKTPLRRAAPGSGRDPAERKTVPPPPIDTLGRLVRTDGRVYAAGRRNRPRARHIAAVPGRLINNSSSRASSAAIVLCVSWSLSFASKNKQNQTKRREPCVRAAQGRGGIRDCFRAGQLDKCRATQSSRSEQ